MKREEFIEHVAQAIYENIPTELVGGDNDRVLSWEEHQEYFKESPEMSEKYRWDAEAAITAVIEGLIHDALTYQEEGDDENNEHPYTLGISDIVETWLRSYL